MKTIRRVLWSVLLLGAARLAGQTAGVAGAAAEDPLMMKPYVLTQFFDVYAELGEDKVTVMKVTVTSAAPGTQKRGVRVGDRVVEIAGTPTAGMPVETLKALITEMPKPGEKREFVFVRNEGLFGRKVVTNRLELMGFKKGEAGSAGAAAQGGAVTAPQAAGSAKP